MIHTNYLMQQDAVLEFLRSQHLHFLVMVDVIVLDIVQNIAQLICYCLLDLINIKQQQLNH